MPETDTEARRLRREAGKRARELLATLLDETQLADLRLLRGFRLRSGRSSVRFAEARSLAQRVSC